MNLEHEIERYPNVLLEYDGQDPVALYKTRKVSLPITSRMASDYFVVFAMSAPAEALFSQMGDVVSTKRNNLSPAIMRMIAILKLFGFIQDDEIPEEYLNIEENGKSPGDLGEERQSTEKKVWLTIEGIEDVDI